MIFLILVGMLIIQITDLTILQYSWHNKPPYRNINTPNIAFPFLLSLAFMTFFSPLRSNQHSTQFSTPAGNQDCSQFNTSLQFKEFQIVPPHPCSVTNALDAASLQYYALQQQRRGVLRNWWQWVWQTITSALFTAKSSNIALLACLHLFITRGAGGSVSGGISGVGVRFWALQC